MNHRKHHSGYYYWITDEMRKAGLYGPYLDMVGPWGTRRLRDKMKAAAEQRAAQMLKEVKGE